MKKLQNKQLVIFGFVLSFLLIPFVAQAGAFTDALGSIGNYFFNIGKGASLLFIIANIIAGLFALIGVLSLLFLIIGGFRYVTAYGSAEQAEGAKKTILYAIIGLALAISAYVIVKAVAQALFKG